MQHSLTQCEIIPNRIILRNNNYIHRKIIINKKFEWLNKYISASSPRIFNSNTFIANHTHHKLNYQTKRYRTYLSGSILKTQNSKDYSVSNKDNALMQKNTNTSQFRKTVSSQVNINMKSTFKKGFAEQSSISKFFRNKKNRSQFSAPKRCQNNQNFNRYRKIDDSQIKPWNIQRQDQDDNQNLCFKQNLQNLPK